MRCGRNQTREFGHQLAVFATHDLDEVLRFLNADERRGVAFDERFDFGGETIFGGHGSV
ncbi:hypothetical protein ACU4HD_43770 [Cupriavidus basilensis]